MEKILIIGGGGREHAIAWKLSTSPKVGSIFVAPGNAGTAKEEKTVNIDLNVKNIDHVIKFCREEHITLVVVGPEDPLAEGIVDQLTAACIPCFGPQKAAAQIEADKSFAKAFMERHAIPTARYKIFTDYASAEKHIRTVPYNAWVLKASGLAAGKGVVVAGNTEEACAAAKHMFEDRPFGTAGDKLVIEELLEGEEVSVLCFTDGDSVKVMPASQDHKRLLDGDHGPNTGGMGAYAPCPEILSNDMLQVVERDFLLKTIQCLKKENICYKGVLYAGLMVTREGPVVLEFNCRFGDPETESILCLLKSDLFDILHSCVETKLSSCNIEWCDNTFALGVVVVSGGYPEKYEKGKRISTDLQTLSNSSPGHSFVKVFHAGTTTSSHGDVVTSGGRVLCIVAISSKSLSFAQQAATDCASRVVFDGAQFRKDIGFKSINKLNKRNQVAVDQNGLTYESAGVSIARGDAFVEGIKKHCAGTKRIGADVDIGGFGGLFDVKKAGFKDPILVSGTDGVGTKLKIAHDCGLHGTVGIDLVAMCVNDVLAHGAEPLFFLDYFATGRLDNEIATKVVSGIAEGCRQANCALIGGETAEMPGFYQDSEYDLAGFVVGAVERDKVLPLTNKIQDGDVLLGLGSSGLHSNGYSLVRKIVESTGHSYADPCPWNKAKSFGEELLAPTKIYVRSTLSLLRSGKVKALAHITGGGIVGNLPRVFPSHLNARVDASSWDMPAVFRWLATAGKVAPEEMAKTFNCGLGVILVVSAAHAAEVKQALEKEGETVFNVGNMIKPKTSSNDPKVDIVLLKDAFKWDPSWGTISGQHFKPKVRVGVMLSGTGSNFQAMLDHTRNPAVNSVCEIVLVISNIPGVGGLQKAESAGIPTKVISHKEFKSRVDFDMVIHEQLQQAKVEVVCLAGFMRILSAEFCQLWHGKMLNIHPSLLPSFKGGHAAKDALESGVRVTGATVHFVVPEVDSGAIVYQEAVPVLNADTVETLQQRIHTVEHKIFPKAMEIVARKQAVFSSDNKVIWKN